MRTAFALAMAALVLVLTSPAIAAGVPMLQRCATTADVEAAVRSSGAAAIKVRGETARRLVAAYNAWPPATEIVADELIVSSAGGRVETLYLLFRGCLVRWEEMPAGWTALSIEASK